MYAIEKHMSFSAAHLLNDLDGDHPCQSIHGHNYDVVIRIESTKLDRHGFVIDFNNLKLFKKNFIDGQLDHSTIITHKSLYNIDENKEIFRKVYTLPDRQTKNTTVEILSIHICDVLEDHLKSIGFNNFSKIVIRVSETNGNTGEFSRNFDVEDSEASPDMLLHKVKKMDARIKQLEKELEESDPHIDNDDLQDLIDRLETRVNDLQQHVEGDFDERITSGMEDLESKIDCVEENNQDAINDLEERLIDLEEKIEELENAKEDSTDELEERIKYLIKESIEDIKEEIIQEFIQITKKKISLESKNFRRHNVKND